MPKQPERKGLLKELAALFSLSEDETETIRELLGDKTIPCFLCKRNLEIRFSKKNRPYTVCDYCQTQTFVRGRKGIAQLATLVQERDEWE